MTSPEPAATLFLPDLTDTDGAAAAEQLDGMARQAPVLTSRTLNRQTNSEIFFKCENFQSGRGDGHWPLRNTNGFRYFLMNMNPPRCLGWIMNCDRTACLPAG